MRLLIALAVAVLLCCGSTGSDASWAARVQWSRATHAGLVAEYGLTDDQSTAIMEHVVCSGWYDEDLDTSYSWQWLPVTE